MSRMDEVRKKLMGGNVPKKEITDLKDKKDVSGKKELPIPKEKENHAKKRNVQIQGDQKEILELADSVKKLDMDNRSDTVSTTTRASVSLDTAFENARTILNVMCKKKGQEPLAKKHLYEMALRMFIEKYDSDESFRESLLHRGYPKKTGEPQKVSPLQVLTETFDRFNEIFEEVSLKRALAGEPEKIYLKHFFGIAMEIFIHEVNGIFA